MRLLRSKVYEPYSDTLSLEILIILEKSSQQVANLRKVRECYQLSKERKVLSIFAVIS